MQPQGSHVSSITQAWLDIMVVLYVNDTDLYILGTCIQSQYNLWAETQRSVRLGLTPHIEWRYAKAREVLLILGRVQVAC